MMDSALQGVASPARREALSNTYVLWQKIALAQPRLDDAAQQFWSSPNLGERIRPFFLTLYAVVHGGLQLMHVAHRRSSELADTGDAAAAVLSGYLARHIEEERDHESWLLDDMEHCGIERGLAEARIVTGAVAALLGAQQYWIESDHPVAYLGYLAVIEGNPPSRRHLAEIQQRTGLKDEALRTMREHADADEGHSAELQAVIDSLPLTERQQQLLALSAFETIHALGRVFDELSVQRGQGT